jgi:hypothetical protein
MFVQQRTASGKARSAGSAADSGGLGLAPKHSSQAERSQAYGLVDLPLDSLMSRRLDWPVPPIRTLSGRLAAVLLVAGAALPSAASAKTLIDYFQPTPIACPLTKSTWGASSSVPRDTCNGLEDTKNPPQWIYWDGKILRAADGKYHMLASRWSAALGHNGGWQSSDAILAVSDSSPLGPYVDKGFAYTNGPDSGDRSKGHNVSGAQLPDGSYCLIVSEIVPFTVFTAPSLDGPWTNKGHAAIDNNGITVSLQGDTHIESNVSLVVRPDGNFEIIQRHGIIALSTTGVTGPYKVQRPTTKYSAAETPPANFPTIFPIRQKHLDTTSGVPSTPESTAALAEDPLIWYSGGQYHVIYDYPDDRVGYHLTSLDGIHDWTDQGLAYDPRMAKQLFSYTDGTAVSWNKMERPNIIMDNGHITHFTFAVTDVDKGQITGGSSHGNKVIVMAFDGVSFDAETGVAVDGGAGGSSGTGGSGGIQGGAGGSGTSGSGGMPRDAGTAGAGGNAAPGGSSATGGTSGSGGMPRDAGTAGASGGAGTGGDVTGGITSSLGTGGAGGGSSGRGGSATTGGNGSGGMVTGMGGALTGRGGSTGAAGTGGSGGAPGGATSQGGATSANGGSSGCACSIGNGRGARSVFGFGCTATLLGLLALARTRRQRRRRGPAKP